MTDPRPYAAAVALLSLFALGLWPLVKTGFCAFRKQGVLFCLIAAGFLVSMATKPESPRVQFDEYVADNGTHYITNGVTKLGVSFKWKKTNAALPDEQPLFISKRIDNLGAPWTLEATTTVGAGSFDLSISSPETYQYFLWHEWVPPHPVHTNGVWLGEVLEKANGTTGVEKMIIIHGQIKEHGKVIAP